MTTAGEICSRVAKTLFDDTKTRWIEPELLEYLTDAQLEVVLLKPSAFTKNEAVQLTPGVVQALPSDGVAFIDIAGNMGAGGVTQGRVVTQIDRTVLEASRPDWRSSVADITTQHYIYDDRDPQRYEIYPPQPNPAGYVQLTYAAVPPAVLATIDVLSLPDIYNTALYYIVLSRAFSKSTGTQDFIKSSNYLQLAHQLITGRKASKRELHPDQIAERTKR